LLPWSQVVVHGARTSEDEPAQTHDKERGSEPSAQASAHAKEPIE